MLKYFISIIVFSLVISCNNSVNNDNNEENDTILNTGKKPSGITTFFKLPSPVELFIFLNEENVKYNNKLINSPENLSKYITTNSKAINFGIYTSDLIYSTVFGVTQQTVKYFTISKKLADDLNLTKGFNEQIVKSIDKNINNPDSLFKIINNSYSEVTNLFQDKTKAKLLPLIVTGAWIESLYIAINSVSNFTNENLNSRIAEQQLLLENLIDYFKSLKPEDQNKEIYDKLIDLKTSFDKLYDNNNIIITKTQFDEISKKVSSLRLEFISK